MSVVISEECNVMFTAPKKWWNCAQVDINKCKITYWKKRSKNRADWEKSVKKANVRIGL